MFETHGLFYWTEPLESSHGNHEVNFMQQKGLF